MALVRSTPAARGARLAVGLSGLLLVCGLTALAGRRASWGLALATAVPFTLLLSSLGEWLVHRVLYHARIPGLGLLRRIHQHGHHVALFPPSRYVQQGPHEFMRVRAPLLPFRMAESRLDNQVTRWSQVGLHFAVGGPLILLPAWLLTARPAFLGGCLVTLAVVSFALAHVHGVMHTPRNRWIERQRWFRWLDRRHYIHHVNVGVNLNFLLPLCDLLWGTHRLSLTASEAARVPSFETARRQLNDRQGTGTEAVRGAAR
jgi:hypothetical protein